MADFPAAVFIHKKAAHRHANEQDQRQQNLNPLCESAAPHRDQRAEDNGRHHCQDFSQVNIVAGHTVMETKLQRIAHKPPAQQRQRRSVGPQHGDIG